MDRGDHAERSQVLVLHGSDAHSGGAEGSGFGFFSARADLIGWAIMAASGRSLVSQSVRKSLFCKGLRSHYETSLGVGQGAAVCVPAVAVRFAGFTQSLDLHSVTTGLRNGVWRRRFGLGWAGDGGIGRDDSQKVDLILEKALEHSRSVR